VQIARLTGECTVVGETRATRFAGLSAPSVSSAQTETKVTRRSSPSSTVGVPSLSSSRGCTRFPIPSPPPFLITRKRICASSLIRLLVAASSSRSSIHFFSSSLALAARPFLSTSGSRRWREEFKEISRRARARARVPACRIGAEICRLSLAPSVGQRTRGAK